MRSRTMAVLVPLCAVVLAGFVRQRNIQFHRTWQHPAEKRFGADAYFLPGNDDGTGSCAVYIWQGRGSIPTDTMVAGDSITFVTAEDTNPYTSIGFTQAFDGRSFFLVDNKKNAAGKWESHTYNLYGRPLFEREERVDMLIRNCKEKFQYLPVGARRIIEKKFRNPLWR